MFIKVKNKKTKKYYHEIFEIESNYKILNEINISELKKLYNKFNQYKYTVNLLYSYSDFYLDIKDIELSNKNIDPNLFLMMENIWYYEYYDFIYEIRSIEPILLLLMKDSYKYGFITKIQFELIKIIKPKIINIFESDIILKSLYDFDTKKTYPSEEEINYYFDIISIIIYKLFEYHKNKSVCQIEQIISNKKYMNAIKKIKNIKKKRIIKYL